MSTWSKSATQKLSRRAPTDRLRIAIIGIGYEFGGDDAAGLSVAQSLLKISKGQDSKNLLVIDAGVAPENYTGVMRRFEPAIVLLVDAAQMNEAPGTVAWLDWRETSGMAAVTHGLPPYMLAQYLTTELKCEVFLIGIQPAGNKFNSQMSEEVSRAVREVSQTLANLVIIPDNDPDSPDQPLAREP
jgi:hydrogenase 3 maturation protease